MNEKAPFHLFKLFEKHDPRIAELGAARRSLREKRTLPPEVQAAFRSALAWVRKNAGKGSLALVIYLAILFMLASGASIGLFFPQAVLRKVLQSDHPNISLIAFCAAAIAGVWIILRLGLEIANFPLKFSENTLSRFRQYSFWYPTSLMILSTGIFLSSWNPCQAPAVTFTLTSTQASGAIQPNAIINAAPNEMLIFTVNPVNGSAIGCTWNRAGNGIARIGQTSGCASTIWLAPEPGAAILTVAVNEGICPNQDVYSFPIMIRKP